MKKKLKNKNIVKKIKQNQFGGAAIEYIVISTFAILLAIAAVGFVTSVIKGKISVLESKLGVSFDEEFNIFE